MTHWDTVEYFLINAIMIGLVGFLIKHELNDIKARIVRLENLFLHPPDKDISKNKWATVALFFGLSLLSSSAYAATQNMGSAVSQPSGVFELCGAPKFCPRIVAPDWSNPTRMYGTDPTCRLSNDGGSTWAACTTQPSATNSNFSITVARDGSVLWMGNDAGGTVFNIRRSTNGTVSWATAFTTATTDTGSFSGTSKIKCAQLSQVCIAYYVNAGVYQTLVSLDNGASWASGTTGTASPIPHTLALSQDGTIGFAPPSTSLAGIDDVALLFTGGVWSRSIPWQTTVGGTCWTGFVIGGGRRGICHQTTLGISYQLRDEDGVNQGDFDYQGIFTGNPVLIANTAITGWVGSVSSTSTGTGGVWESFSSGLNPVRSGDISGEGPGNQFDTFQLNNCMYVSYIQSGLGRLVAICP